MEGHPHHARAMRWWRQDVVPDRRVVAFCRVTQLGLIRLLSNETVMGAQRRTPEAAWSDYDGLADQPIVAFLDEPEGVEEALRRYTAGRPPTVSLWTDAYLAAFASAARIELATFDRGFRTFAGLDLKLLTS